DTEAGETRRNSPTRAAMTGPPSSTRVQIAWRYSSAPLVGAAAASVTTSPMVLTKGDTRLDKSELVRAAEDAGRQAENKGETSVDRRSRRAAHHAPRGLRDDPGRRDRPRVSGPDGHDARRALGVGRCGRGHRGQPRVPRGAQRARRRV